MNQPVSNQQGTVNPDDSFQKIRLARLLQIQEELDLRKALYAEYDQIVLELAHSGFTQAIIDDLVLELEDNLEFTIFNLKNQKTIYEKLYESLPSEYLKGIIEGISQAIMLCEVGLTEVGK